VRRERPQLIGRGHGGNLNFFSPLSTLGNVTNPSLRGK
jgi:hypothetical protein